MASNGNLGNPWISGLSSHNNQVTVNVHYTPGGATDFLRSIVFELRSSGHTPIASSLSFTTPGVLTAQNFSVTFTGLAPNRTYTVHAIATFADHSVQHRVAHSSFTTGNWGWVDGGGGSGGSNWVGGQVDWIRLEPITLTSNSVSVRVHAWGWGGRPNNWSGNWYGWDNNFHGGIRDVGAVMSRDSNPRLNNADSRLVQPSTGGSVTFRNLQSHTTYFIRGFVETSHGRFYGPVYSFRPGVGWQGAWDRWDPWGRGNLNWWTAGAERDRSFINTNQPIEVTTTTARMSAHIPNRSTGTYWNNQWNWNNQWGNNWSQWEHRVLERGFVWSSTNRLPTLSDSSARQNTNAAGTFEMTLTGLTPGTTYNVSAFYRTNSRVFYGNVVTITTPAQGTQIGDNAVVTVTFRNLNGQDISTAVSIPTTVGTTLNASNLSIPDGFTMWPADWSYVVTGSANIVVILAPAGHVPPTVQTPTVSGEFFAGRNGFAFAPEAAVSRGELAEAIFNLYAGSRTPTGTSMRFTDTVNSPFSAAIDFVTAMGYMNGYPDGTFRPTGSLSRAEAAAVLVRIYGLTGVGSATFSDLPAGNWARNYVALAADRGIIQGYPDGTFGPNRPLSRAETVALLVRADGRNLNPLQQQRFTDVPEWHWAFNYIMSASVPRQ